MTLVFPEMILLESGLSFLGLGVQPPMTSLGNMVGLRPRIPHPRALDHAGAGDHHRADHACGLMLGDWLRDQLDPTLR